MPQIPMTMSYAEWEREQLAALQARRARRQPITAAEVEAQHQRWLVEAMPRVNARAAEIRAARAAPLPPERVWIPGSWSVAAPASPGSMREEEDEEREDTDDLVTELGGAKSSGAALPTTDRWEGEVVRAEPSRVHRKPHHGEVLRLKAAARALKLANETRAAWVKVEPSLERLAAELGVTVATARDRLVRADITPPPRPAPAPKPAPPPKPSKPAKEPKPKQPAQRTKEEREAERLAKQEVRRARVAAIWEQAELDLDRAAELLGMSRTATRVLLVRHGLWKPTDPEEAQRARAALSQRLLAAVQAGKTVDEARRGEDISRNTAYKLLHNVGWESGRGLLPDAKLKELREQGLSCDKIAEQVGLTRGRVITRLAELPDDPLKGKLKNAGKWPPAVRAKMAERYLAGATVSELATEFRGSTNSIRIILRSLGHLAPATPRPAAVMSRARAKQPKLDTTKLRLMRAAGVSLAQIALIYDRTPEQIAELLKELP